MRFGCLKSRGPRSFFSSMLLGFWGKVSGFSMTLQKWVHDPIILGNDQPFCKGHGDSRWMEKSCHWRWGLQSEPGDLRRAGGLPASAAAPRGERIHSAMRRKRSQGHVLKGELAIDGRFRDAPLANSWSLHDPLKMVGHYPK